MTKPTGAAAPANGAGARLDRLTVAGIVVAAVLWFLLFSPSTELTATIHNQWFWVGMTTATTLLGVYTLVVQRRELGRLFHFEWRFVWIGLAHAVVLYGLSRFGVWFMATFFSWVMPQIEAIYGTRAQLDPRLIAVLLVGIIAPFEEIFWRGLVLDKLLGVTSGKRALAMAIGLYCLVHIWAFNPMLLVAALVLGAHWSYLYYRFRSLVPGLISHAVWDVAIFVLLPVPIGG